MIIEKIDIKSFGLIRDMTLQFSRSVNVIEGQNEAGKSTIAAFIKYMLFGFDSIEKDDVLSERRKRINWDTQTAEGSMIVTVKGKRYQISRSTIPSTRPDGRPSYREESSITDMESGTTAFGKQAAGEVFFGVDRELFENTAFVGQIGDSAINEGSVKESIENILFSGSEKINNQRAMTKIREKQLVLQHDSGNGGVIHDLTRKKEQLEVELARADEDNKQIHAKENELYSIKKKREEAQDKLERLYDLDSSHRSAGTIDSFDRLHALEEDVAKKNEEYNTFLDSNTRAGYIPTDSYIGEIASARRGVNDAYHALADAEDNLMKEKNRVGITRDIEGAIEHADEEGGEDNILARGASYFSGIVKNIAFASISALAVIAVIIYEIIAAGVLAHVAFRAVFGAVGVGALAFGVISVLKLLRNRKALANLAEKFGVDSYKDLKGKIALIREKREMRDSMIRATEDARVALEAARLTYDNAKAELTRVIIRWGEEPPSSALNDFLDRLENKVNGFLEQKRKLLEEKHTLELTMNNLRSELAGMNEIDIRAKVPQIKRKALAQINRDEISNSIAAYSGIVTELDKDIYAVECEISSLKVTVKDPAETYTKIRALEERLEELRSKHRSYIIAIKAIEGASDRLREEISPRLGEFSTELMGIMTDKKYGDFDVSDGLKVSYISEDGEKRTIDFLSGGTRDLAYIAVRMALIDMLYTEKPPVLFDESFAHQDNNRAKSMMKSLAYLAKDGYQSFIFTCRGREGTLAAETVKKAGLFKLSVVEN